MMKSRRLMFTSLAREAAVWVNCLFLPCPEIKARPTVTVPVKERSTVCARSFHHFKTVGDESEAPGSGNRKPMDTVETDPQTASRQIRERNGHRPSLV